MIERFNNSDTAGELLRRAIRLEIDLYRNAEGGIEASFKCSGSAGPPDDNMMSGVGGAQANDLRFLSDLLKAFERRS